MAESWGWWLQAFNSLAETRILRSTTELVHLNCCPKRLVARGHPSPGLLEICSPTWLSYRDLCAIPKHAADPGSGGIQTHTGVWAFEGARQEPSSTGAEGEGTWALPAVTREASAKVWEQKQSGKCSWQLFLGLHGYEVTFMPIT